MPRTKQTGADRSGYLKRLRRQCCERSRHTQADRCSQDKRRFHPFFHPVPSFPSNILWYLIILHSSVRFNYYFIKDYYNYFGNSV